MDRIEKFRAAHYGLFIHWGAYTIRGFEASWPLVREDIPWQAYDDLANQFDPKDYDAKAWAALAKDAGVQYAVLTSKHHDGFALFDTKLDDYSAPNRKAGRDLVREYVDAFREAGILVGFYFSLCDWHHADYPVALSPDRPGYTRKPHAVTPGAPASIAADPARWDRYIAFMHGQVRELLTNYGDIDLLWLDGQWEHTAEEWRSAELVDMIHELQPGCIVNDRLADPLLGDYSTPEQYVPLAGLDRPWETCMTINEQWSYDPFDRAYKSPVELLATFAEVTAKGGNFLINVGPSADGDIPPEFASRLRVIGDWIAKNRESVFDVAEGLPTGSFYGPSTGKDNALYLFALGSTNGDELRVRGLTRRVSGASILATGQPLAFEQHRQVLSHGFLRVHLPSDLIDPLATVVKLDLLPA
jgi:alpha-L-fucosidase